MRVYQPDIPLEVNIIQPQTRRSDILLSVNNFIVGNYMDVFDFKKLIILSEFSPTTLLESW